MANNLVEVIWNHLESFKSWGNKICYIIDLQCSLSFFGGVSDTVNFPTKAVSGNESSTFKLSQLNSDIMRKPHKSDKITQLIWLFLDKKNAVS